MAIGIPPCCEVQRQIPRNENEDKGEGHSQEVFMTIPIQAEPERCSVFAEPLTADVRFGDDPSAAVERADVLAICADHLELAMPTRTFHQVGEPCQVSFELNGAQRVLACTLLWFSMHELVSIMGVGLG
jgi:hypothetical protein